MFEGKWTCFNLQQASLLLSFWEIDLPLYAWSPAYYRDRSLIETHSEPSVSLLSFYRNRDILNILEPSSRINTTPKFFIETRGQQTVDLTNYHKWLLTICDGWFDTLKSSKMQS